ncbi:hypothetical protein IVIADoCa7_34 [Xanthomonas phage vB_Xar_IVIA-DoCa7]|uniref:Uncharacterized protein n=1 Tax=Xanthomonas phage vB_Xar_IVIA-DoCa7 TaxID=2975534 RepID=A0A9X9NYC9_9CAUD|nr:hypothetical protein IVIADoCa7_34 [Xanthomonas phage vB_Xar_IVIA-DoCa7]
MAQSKLRSIKEAWVNIGIGYSINYGANIVLLPLLWNADHPYMSAHAIGVAFTAISFIRQYIIRRWFNKKES